jgi:hypothetical protein
MKSLQISHVLNISGKGYRFNATYTGLDYNYDEMMKYDLGGGRFHKTNLSKEELIRSIKYNLVDRETKINEKAFTFFMENHILIRNEKDSYNVFFHDIIVDMVNDYLKAKVDNRVLTLSILGFDLVNNKVTVSDGITADNQYIDHLEIDFEYADNYLEIYEFIQIVKDIVQDENITNFDMMLVCKKSSFEKPNFLFDLPIFIKTYNAKNNVSVEHEIITIFEVFSTHNWDGNFLNFFA